ncbi:hypothetical protein BDD12DRAFT_832270 [Trichophaea hybrida]|nr:hypothetical protein BDD12DRAFT_832270 [Trichophaea hybrida]
MFRTWISCSKTPITAVVVVLWSNCCSSLQTVYIHTCIRFLVLVMYLYPSGTDDIDISQIDDFIQLYQASRTLYFRGDICCAQANPCQLLLRMCRSKKTIERLEIISHGRKGIRSIQSEISCGAYS